MGKLIGSARGFHPHKYLLNIVMELWRKYGFATQPYICLSGVFLAATPPKKHQTDNHSWGLRPMRITFPYFLCKLLPPCLSGATYRMLVGVFASSGSAKTSLLVKLLYRWGE